MMLAEKLVAETKYVLTLDRNELGWLSVLAQNNPWRGMNVSGERFVDELRIEADASLELEDVEDD